MRRSEREIKRRLGESAAVPYQKEALQETIRRSKTAFNEKDAAHPLTSSVGRAPISESAGGGQAALLLVLWGGYIGCLFIAFLAMLVSALCRFCQYCMRCSLRCSCRCCIMCTGRHRSGEEERK